MRLDAGGLGEEPFGAVVPAPAGYLPPWERSVIAEAAQAGLRPLAAGAPAARPGDAGAHRGGARRGGAAAGLPRPLPRPRGDPLRLRRQRLGRRDPRPCSPPSRTSTSMPPTRPFWGKQGWVNALIARRATTAGTCTSTPTSGWSSTARRVDGRPGRGLADLVAFAEARGLRRLRGMLVDLYPPGPARRAGARRPAVRRRRLRRDALPRAGLAQGRAAAPRLRRRPRAHQVPAVPHPRRRGGRRARTTCTPTARTTARTASSGSCTTSSAPASAPRPSAPPPRATTGGAASSTAATLAALARDPGLALAYPGSRRYRAPADLVAAGLIAPIPWAGGSGLRPGSSPASPAGGRGCAVALRLSAGRPQNQRPGDISPSATSWALSS